MRAVDNRPADSSPPVNMPEQIPTHFLADDHFNDQRDDRFNDQCDDRIAAPEILHFERASHRIPFPESLYVVGLEIDPDEGQFNAASDRIVASGRDISADGISFRHEEPILHKFVAVGFRGAFGTKMLVVKLAWSQVIGHQDYLSSGGLIVKPRLSPDLKIDWGSMPST